MKTNEPRLLVATPTLGNSPHLDRTVASIEALGLDVLHVMSAPRDRVERLRGRHHRSLVIPDGGREAGMYGALNRVLESFPDGWDWFTYINDDDVLLPSLAGAARRHWLRAHPEPVAFGNVDLIDGEGLSISPVAIEPDPSWFPALLQAGISPLMQQGTLFSHATVRTLGGFDLRYRLCADLDFWLRAYAAGGRFRHLGTTVAQFRIHGAQLSSDTETTRGEQDAIVRRLVPARAAAWRRLLAVPRFRLINLPAYAARMRSRGFCTSYELLERGAARK